MGRATSLARLHIGLATVDSSWMCMGWVVFVYGLIDLIVVNVALTRAVDPMLRW